MVLLISLEPTEEIDLNVALGTAGRILQAQVEKGMSQQDAGGTFLRRHVISYAFQSAASGRQRKAHSTDQPSATNPKTPTVTSAYFRKPERLRVVVLSKCKFRDQEWPPLSPQNIPAMPP